MTSLYAMRVLLYGGEAFAAVTLAMGLAWLASNRETASQRHLVWLGAFGALIALPAFALIVPSQLRLSLPVPVIPVTQGFDASVASLAEPSGFSIDASTIALALIALWLAGVCAIAARGLIAAFALRRLRRGSVAHKFGHLPIAGPRCELRVAAEDCGPMTWGFLRPIILLPSDSVTWPRARLEAVLMHELAHIRRGDSLAQILSLTVCALYWPNPLVWIGARRLRREAEIAADDAVIASGVRPSVYAGELLQIASEFRAYRFALPLGMAEKSGLEARVQSVLAPNKSRSGVTSMDVFKIVCLGMMATTAIAFARPSLAQDAPPPAPVMTAPLPPADTMPPAPPPAPPAPPPAPQADVAPLPPMPPMEAAGTHTHVRILRELSPRDKARIRAEVRQAMARAKPEIERAVREAHVAEKAEAAMRAAQPRIEAAMIEAQKAAAPEIARAMARERAALARMPSEDEINARVARAMERAHVHMHDAHMDDAHADDGDTDTDAHDQDDDEAPDAPSAH
jgi:beta-lactamase regulating signal transducer with metallopeptidase domain